MKRRPLGRSGLEVTPICLGCAPLGSMRRDFGYEVPLERALDTLRAFFSSGLNFLDTSNGYGGGESEKRIGIVLAEMGELPPGFVLSTKIDPDPETGSFDGDRAWRSLEESLGRLGVDHVDLLHLHDPERIGFDLAMAKGGPVQALVAMREQGLATAIGVAGGPVGMLEEFLDTEMFDVVLTHNRYTLLDRSAQPLIEKANAASVGVMNAAVFSGGILAKGPSAMPRYAYKPLDETIRHYIEELYATAGRFGFDLRAAAIQFSLRMPAIGSTVVGASHPNHLEEVVKLATEPIDEQAWRELENCVLPMQHWLG